MSEQQKPTTISQENFEANQNLVGFFELLLRIDQRNNPEFYENK